MAELTGQGVTHGLGLGPVRKLTAAQATTPAHDCRKALPATTSAAVRAALDALGHTADDLERRGRKAGGPAQQILRAQALMARDPALAEEVRTRVMAGSPAANAVYDAFQGFRQVLDSTGGYLSARVADLDDVRDRAVSRLLGRAMPAVPEAAEPFVLVARDLSPADTALLDPEQVVAFVTEEGGPTSHTAILARSLGIPAVVACEGAASLPDGLTVLVDGARGIVDTEPELSATLRVLDSRRSKNRRTTEADQPGRTADGHHVQLLANIGRPLDLVDARASGAEGIGLYRTEFLFLNRNDLPSEDEQAVAYRQALASFPRGRVVIRVLDAGADKQLSFLPTAGTEPNPALGERGWRLLQHHPHVLEAQLRALAVASIGASAQLDVMAPMVAGVRDAQSFAEACRRHGLERPGTMIEVPIAAIRVADLAAEAAFFSIGTNDLTQYASAADRQLGKLAHLNDPWQPGVLDLIALAATAAKESCKPLGICGEAAADPPLACVLVGLGADSLSMSPRAIPGVRTALRAHSLEACTVAAAAARAAVHADDARKAAMTVLSLPTDRHP